MNDDLTAVSIVHDREKPVIIDRDLNQELLAGLISQNESNTSRDVLFQSDSNRMFIKDENWFNLSMTYKPAFSNIIMKNSTNEFLSIQKWEGIVESIDIENSTFTATVIDLSSGKQKRGLVEFDKDEVNPGDWDLILDGSVFYWNIGYQYNQGVRSKSSLIRFSRLPIWGDKFQADLKARAIERLSKINPPQITRSIDEPN